VKATKVFQTTEIHHVGMSVTVPIMNSVATSN